MTMTTTTKNTERRPGMAARSKKSSRTRREPKPSHPHNGSSARSVPLRSLTEQALDDYFTSLNGHAPGHLYDLVLREVEEPLFRAVLDYSDGNQSRAADILGINRGTLRKKLRVYGIEG
jgi:Fis family transcriptional regulator